MGVGSAEQNRKVVEQMWSCLYRKDFDGVAALIAGLVPKAEGNIVCIVSGGNVDMDKFTRIVSGEYSEA